MQSTMPPPAPVEAHLSSPQKVASWGVFDSNRQMFNARSSVDNELVADLVE